MKQHASVIHLLQFQMPNTEVISASFEQSGVFHLFHDTFIDNLPPFHRILLQIQSGKNGLSHTEIWLPEKWNGILIGTGNGGMAGSIANMSFWRESCFLRHTSPCFTVYSRSIPQRISMLITMTSHLTRLCAVMRQSPIGPISGKRPCVIGGRRRI